MQEAAAQQQSLLALKKKQYEVKFDLDGTKYLPIENIGTGAYGVVCSAIDKTTADKVAIKKIPGIFDMVTLAKRTYREIKILKHFNHDNIISIREILKPKDKANLRDIYIVLDLMESDLHRIIHSAQDLTDEHVRFFLYQLLRGLKYIHSANVIHRDLKPSNLLVNENCDLKIGDFGMARGIDQSFDTQKNFMTQYVATRWYRAPELMLSMVEYTTSIDVWSVGCIFAEMLGRRQLFPGRDFIHQMKLIVGILGTPSKEMLKLSHSDMVTKFVKGLGQKAPVPLKELYPSASRKALDLLGKMLVFNPRERITVEAALKHPYLNKYHDPDDEPICIPAFKFDFEKEDLNLAEVKEAIIKEIMEYHEPKKPLHLDDKFNLRPVRVDSQQSSGSNKATPKTASDEEDPGASALQALLEFQRKIEDEKKQKGEKSPTVQSPGKLHVSSPRRSDVKAPAQAIRIPTTPADIEMLSARTQNVSLNQRPEAHHAGGDVEMPSAKMEAKKEEKAEGELDAKARIKAAILNAGLRRKQIEEGGLENVNPRPVTALQRQREREEKRRKKAEKAAERKKKSKAAKVKKEEGLLLSEEDRKLLEKWKTMQNQPKSHARSGSDGAEVKQSTHARSASSGSNVINLTDSPSPKPPLSHPLPTAHQLQQNHHVPPRHQIQQVQQTHQGQQAHQAQGHQVQQSYSVQPVQTQQQDPTLLVPDSKVKVEPASENIRTQFSSNIPPVVQPSNGSIQGNTTAKTATTTAKPDAPLSHIAFNVPNANNVTNFQTTTTTMNPNGLPFMSYGVSPDAGRMSRSGSHQVPHVTARPPPGFPQLPPAVVPPPAAVGAGAMIPANPITTATALPSYDEALQAKMSSIVKPPMAHTFGSNTTQQQQQQQQQRQLPQTGITEAKNLNYGNVTSENISETFKNSSAHRNTIPFSEESQDSPPVPKAPASSPQVGSTSIIAGLPAGVVPPVTPSSQQQLPANWLNMLTQKMFRSHVEDLTLAQTPKGTGAGYGLGVDIDAILRETEAAEPKDVDGNKLDSAPLSASLIADWLDVSGNMDPSELEALQQELEMGSPLVFADEFHEGQTTL